MVRHLESWVLSMALAGIVSAGCGACSAASNGGGPPSNEEPASAEEASLEVSDWDTGPQDPLTNTEKQKILDLIEKARKNFKDGQDLPFAAKFANNAKLSPPQAAQLVGKNEIAKYVRKSPKINTLTLSDIEVEGSGNDAIATATVAMTGMTNDPDNKNALTIPVSMECSLLVTLKRNNSGKWRAKNVSCPSLSP